MNGFINLLKPPGMTSNGAVGDIRRLLGVKKAGHMGTLDHGAAGVLPVALGRAARLFDYVIDSGKEYIAEFRLGMTTDTQDSYGAIEAVFDKKDADISEVRLATGALTGEIEQKVPAYSALKTNGQKFYQLARRGGSPETPVRKITVHELEVLGKPEEGTFLIRVHCSKGTYVRTLCVQIAERLGTGAYMSFLLRTRSGVFDIEKAYTIAEIADMAEKGDTSFLLPVDYPIEWMPRADFGQSDFTALANGAEVTAPQKIRELAEGTDFRAYCEGRFVGIGSAGETVRLKKVFITFL